MLANTNNNGTYSRKKTDRTGHPKSEFKIKSTSLQQENYEEQIVNY